MAEVKRVSGKMQFDTEGGRVCATYEMAVEKNKAVGSFTGEIGVTNAELRSKEAVGCFTGEIGVTKADLGNKEAAGTCAGGICVTKAELANKEAAGSCTKEIGVTKAKLRKEAAGSSTSEIGVTKAKLEKEAAGSSTSEIGVTKAEMLNRDAAGSRTREIAVTKFEKEAAGSFTRVIDFTKAERGNKEAVGTTTGMVTEDAWINFVFLTKPPEGIVERKAKPTGAVITKETVPDSFIDILKKRRLFTKLPPVNETSRMYSRFPEMRDLHLSIMVRRNTCIDLHADVLRQHEQKGFAEVGVDFTDGVKKIFILPQH